MEFELLDWYLAVGADEAIEDVPHDWLNAAPIAAPRAAEGPATPRSQPSAVAQSAAPSPAAPSPVVALPQVQAMRSTQAAGGEAPRGMEAILAARAAAAAARDLAELRQAVMDFDGCALKKTATNTVFADGNPQSRLMFIGEAPGADEDRIGRPFVGVSGKLLDRMLATIGIDRGSAYISNMLFWRPPGNRKPSELEIDICRPFVERHITLVNPHCLIFVGGTASAAMLPGSHGITRIRGRWMSFTCPGLGRPIQVMAMYHPSFLLRSPERKRDAWVDLLSIKSKLEEVVSN